LDSSIILSLKLLKYCYFVETETTATATAAAADIMTQASVTPRTGMQLFTLLDALQLFDHGQWQRKYSYYCQHKDGND